MPSGSAQPSRRVIRRQPRSAASYEDEEPTPARSRREEPEEEPRGRRSSRGDSPKRSDLVGSGWAGADREKKEMPSDFAKTFAPEPGSTLIKFLQPEPFAFFRQHWCDWLGKGVKLGYVCIKEDCPVCRVNRAAYKEGHNILDLTDPDSPQVKVWFVGSKMSDSIKELALSERTGPLDRADIYFEVKKTGGGKQGRVAITLSPVKERDVKEDFGFDPFTEDELEEYQEKCWTSDDAVPVSSRETLEEIANQFRD